MRGVDARAKPKNDGTTLVSGSTSTGSHIPAPTCARASRGQRLGLPLALEKLPGAKAGGFEPTQYSFLGRPQRPQHYRFRILRLLLRDIHSVRTSRRFRVRACL